MRKIILGLLIVVSMSAFSQDVMPAKASKDSTYKVDDVEQQDFTVAKSRQDMLLTPPYLSNWIGASNFTKDNIENDCMVEPIAYNRGYVYYSFSKCPVGIEYNSIGVGISMTFRLFGEDAYDFKRSLIEYGYKLSSKKQVMLAENNFGDVGRGVKSVYRLPRKNGVSICEIVEGQAMMFTFYRVRK